MSTTNTCEEYAAAIVSSTGSTEASVAFHVKGKEVIKIDPNGNFMINGEHMTNNIEIYYAFLKFLGFGTNGKKRNTKGMYNEE